MRLVLVGLAVVVMNGCDARGTLGASCIVEGGLLTPSYRCEDALVCNTARQPPKCERANAGALGAPCSGDRTCEVALWCPPGSGPTCSARLTEGASCPAGLGCELGLTCQKTDAGIVCQR